MEQVGQLRKSEQRSRLMYTLVAYASGFTIVGVLAYGLAAALVGGLTVVGTSFVDVDFPFPFFAKPVTYLSVASVAFFYSGLKLWENRIARWPHLRLSMIQLVCVIIAFTAAYEILYNFMLWGAFLTDQLVASNLSPMLVNPNILDSPGGPGTVPWNLVFATKIFLSVFAVSAYVSYFLRRIRRIVNGPVADSLA